MANNPYDWTRKGLRPVPLPALCPNCQIPLVNRGWYVMTTGKVQCLACSAIFEPGKPMHGEDVDY